MTPLVGSQKFIIKPAEYNNVLAILTNMRAPDKTEILATEYDDDLGRIAHKFSRHCELAWVFCLPGGKPVAFLGGTRLWPHFAQVGFVATDDWVQIAVPISRWLKKNGTKLLNHFLVNNVICFAEGNHYQSQKWLCWLGFRPQCMLSHAGAKGENLHIYTLNKKEDKENGKYNPNAA
ncbi:MAG: hypothetical protein ACK5LE_00135 [Alphaproteobacteria bacterium]